MKFLREWILYWHQRIYYIAESRTNNFWISWLKTRFILYFEFFQKKGIKSWKKYIYSTWVKKVGKESLEI